MTVKKTVKNVREVVNAECQTGSYAIAIHCTQYYVALNIVILNHYDFFLFGLM